MVRSIPVLVAVLLVVGVALAASPGHAERCTWGGSLMDTHEGAAVRGRDRAVDALADESPLLGQTHVWPSGTTESRADDRDESGVTFMSIVAPTACVHVGVTLAGTPSAPRFDDAPLAAGVTVTVFSSWEAVTDYIQEDSDPAQTEAEHQPGGWLEGMPSTHSRRIEDVGGHEFWDLHCAVTSSGICGAWTLVAQSESCRAIVVEADVFVGGVDGPRLTRDETIATLVPIVHATFEETENLLASVSCSSYEDDDTRHHFTP